MSYDPTAIDIDFDPRHQRMVGVTAHGNISFNVPFISEVTSTLWQGGCQQGLVLPDHITDLVSLYPWEQYTLDHELRSSLTVRMYDAQIEPDENEIFSIARWINQRQEMGGTVLVHCQAGLNRSGLLAATSLILSGVVDNGEAAIKKLRDSRSEAVLCNSSFGNWLMRKYPTW